MTMADTKRIEMDRMRYTKNKLSANLVLLAIVFNALYFVSIYQSDVGSYYYNMLIGGSIIYNLVFMLSAFLCSEGVKSRKGGYCWALLGIGALQIVRMFIIPARAHSAVATVNKVETLVMGGGQYAYVMICLALSAACCLAAGVTSYRQNRSLNDYLKSMAQSDAQAR